MDTKTRTVVKTISYRTVAALSVFLTALAMNYSAGFGMFFVVMSYTVALVFFIIHERLWELVKWAKDGVNDLKIRSVAKTVSWRLFIMLVMFVFGLFLGLNKQDAFEWVVVSNIVFLLVHYAHERVWNLISWGKLGV